MNENKSITLKQGMQIKQCLEEYLELEMSILKKKKISNQWLSLHLKVPKKDLIKPKHAEGRKW